MITLFKFVHVSCAVLTAAGFVVRGVWMIVGSPRLGRRWVRVAPHVIDTLLLASAVGLAVQLGQYPGTHAWLTAKVTGLAAYIGLGMVALHYGPNKPIRIAAWLGALIVFAYIVVVALTRSAAPWA